MNKQSFFPRPAATALALCLLVTPALVASPLVAREIERGMEPRHQPVVERTDFVFDVAADSAGALSQSEQKRLSTWFKALDLRYGDHVSLTGADEGSLAMRDGITQVVSRFGLLVDGEAPATAGAAPAGMVRIVLSRTIASVPGCPTWHDKGEADFTNGFSGNYGCASASNLATMIADPRDLVEGREHAVDTRGIVSGKAIKAYTEKAPTGAGGLQSAEEVEMNAPWKPAGPNGRDAFHAYVCDEHSLDLVRAVVQEMGWPIEKVYKGGLRNAVQSLSMSASPNVLFVDLSESGDPLNDINSLAEVCEPGTVVIASGQVNDVRLYRDLVASGIQDYLLKPLSADALRDTLAGAQAVFLAPKGDVVDDRPHLMVSVIGTRGGVGASTVATSLAYLSSTKGKRPTALLDLDVHFGTGALSMDLEPGRGLTDAVENPSRIDGLFIERAMVRASETLALLSAEAPINQPLITDGSAYYQLEEELRSAFEWTFVDLPRSMLVQHPHLVHESNVVVVVTEFTLAAARDTIRILSWLKSNAPSSHVVVVANKVQPGLLEIARKDFEHSIERPVDMILPYDAKITTQAAKLGKTVAESGKGSKLGQSFQQLGTLLGDAGTAEPVKDKAVLAKKQKSGGSLLSRLLDVKLPKPGKSKAKAGAELVDN